MGLGHDIAEELRVPPAQVLLLRHSRAKSATLRRIGASLHEDYTCVQPTDSAYDYLAEGKPAIHVVVVIVDDKVEGAYWVRGVEATGTTRTLVSPAFRQFDIEAGYPERPARRFVLEAAPSRASERTIRGWSSPRCAVARHGGRLFDTVVLA